MRTETTTLASALDVLARNIQSQDGVANAAIAKAAERLREQEARITELERELKDAHSQLAECYRLSGADPDGNEDWRLARHAVDEVKRLREESDEAGADLAHAEDRITELERDKARLEWLENKHDVILAGEETGWSIGRSDNFQNFATSVETCRAAIDAAMEAEQ